MSYNDKVAVIHPLRNSAWTSGQIFDETHEVASRMVAKGQIGYGNHMVDELSDGAAVDHVFRETGSKTRYRIFYRGTFSGFSHIFDVSTNTLIDIRETLRNELNLPEDITAWSFSDQDKMLTAEIALFDQWLGHPIGVLLCDAHDPSWADAYEQMFAICRDAAREPGVQNTTLDTFDANAFHAAVTARCKKHGLSGVFIIGGNGTPQYWVDNGVHPAIYMTILNHPQLSYGDVDDDTGETECYEMDLLIRFNEAVDDDNFVTATDHHPYGYMIADYVETHPGDWSGGGIFELPKGYGPYEGFQGQA